MLDKLRDLVLRFEELEHQLNQSETYDNPA